MRKHRQIYLDLIRTSVQCIQTSVQCIQTKTHVTTNPVIPKWVVINFSLRKCNLRNIKGTVAVLRLELLSIV